MNKEKFKKAYSEYLHNLDIEAGEITRGFRLRKDVYKRMQDFCKNKSEDFKFKITDVYNMAVLDFLEKYE